MTTGIRLLSLLLLLVLTGCTKYEVPEIIKIEEGQHASTPFTFRSGKNINWSYTFDLNKANYSFDNLSKGEEALDWNKLVGVKSNFLVSDKNSYMAAWRKSNGKYEWCHYSNDSEGGFHFEVIPVEDQIVTVDFYQENDSLYVDIEGYVKSYHMPSNQTLYYINTWFGGNHTAPNDLYFIRYKIR